MYISYYCIGSLFNITYIFDMTKAIWLFIR
jgi:hypothetical protein